MKSATTKPSSAKTKRHSSKPASDTANKATTDEFEREDMGIAPKE